MMTHKSPLISIVTSTFNASATVERCLKSVSDQTYPHVEHLVVDGASSDGTRAILESHGQELAWWISEPDKGIYDAWNKAIPHVKGEWILFLGADDYLYHSGVLEKMALHLTSAWPTYPVVYGKLIRVAEDSGEKINQLGGPWEILKTSYDYPTRKFTPHIATFHHRSLFNGAETFDRSYKYSADSRLLGAVLLKQDPLYVNMFVSCQTMGGVTSVVETVLERWFEKYRITRELNISVPTGKVVKSFIKACFKRLAVQFISVKQYQRFSEWLKVQRGAK